MKHSSLYRHFVAKADRQHPNRYLPLWMHTRDTMEVMRFLMAHWLPESIIDETGLGREAFEHLVLFLAGVHDIGKISNAFQYQMVQCFPDTRALLEQLTIAEPSNSPDDRDYRHHTIVGAAILSTLGLPDWVCSVVGAHHGKTLPFWDVDTVMKKQRNLYGKNDEQKLWQGAWAEMLAEALEQAGYASIAEIPDILPQPAQMLLIGLLIFADWLASGTARFPLIDADWVVNDAAYPERAQRATDKLNFLTRWKLDETWQYEDLCHERFGYDGSNAVQRAIEEAAGEAEQPGLFILEAPMGVGKTEAALMAGEILAQRRSESGLAFFLPSQATTNAMFDRMMDWLRRMLAEKDETWSFDEVEDSGKITIELAHGKSMLNDKFTELAEQDVLTDEDGADGVTVNEFFMGRKTKLLANFVVGTVDQFLMGALNQKHLMLRHLGLAGKVVVVDEIHAYDAYMTRYMKGMLDWLGAYQTPVILLSATLPGERRAELIGAYLGQENYAEKDALAQERAYPLLTWTDGAQVHTRTIPLDKRSTEVQIVRGLDADLADFLRQQLQMGGCAGVIVNTVRRAQEIARRLKCTFPQYEIMLDHAQFLMPDRMVRETQLLERIGRHSTAEQRNGLIVVGTQVLEQSLDIDFDVLVCDLCPMDLLLQRIGRLHRHEKRQRPTPLQTATCLVLNADGDALEPGAAKIYGEYLLKMTARLLPDVIHLPDDISPLVQETYQLKNKNFSEDEEGILAQRDEYIQHSAQQEEKADRTCIPSAKRVPGRRKTTRLIDGLMDRQIDQSEAQAQAAVRDGLSAIEVLVLQYGADGRIHTVMQTEEPMSVLPDVMPSAEETKVIMRQSLRLLYVFNLPGTVDKVIEELEQIRQTTLREWTQSPAIGRELFLLLNPDGFAQIAGKCVHYDLMYGFQVEKEDTNGGESV